MVGWEKVAYSGVDILEDLGRWDIGVSLPELLV